MTTVIREYQAYDIEDVEKSVSHILGRDVKVTEMDVLVLDYIYLGCVGLKITVDGTTIDYRNEDHGDSFGILDVEIYTDEKYIFNFDIDCFKSYVRKYSCYNAYDIEDVEKNVSRVLGRDVKVAEMDVLVEDCVYLGILSITVSIDGEEVIDYEDSENGDPFGDLTAGIYADEKEIFNFDVNLFKSYVRMDNCDD